MFSGVPDPICSSAPDDGSLARWHFSERPPPRQRHLKGTDSRSPGGDRKAPPNGCVSSFSRDLCQSRAVPADAALPHNLPPSDLESALANPIGSHPLLPPRVTSGPAPSSESGGGGIAAGRVFCVAFFAAGRFERLLRFPVAFCSDHLHPPPGSRGSSPMIVAASRVLDCPPCGCESQAPAQPKVSWPMAETMGDSAVSWAPLLSLTRRGERREGILIH